MCLSSWIATINSQSGLKMTYYDYMFSRLGESSASMQLTNEQGQTHWMNVTAEQIKQILDLLNKAEEA